MASKVTSLEDAIERFVAPGMHLHFASTPSRSNVAIRALCRRYRGLAPGFVLSTTGLHSTAHLLAGLRLGARYMTCFTGDNYPVPRPSPLYDRVVNEGAVIEHWSLLAYTLALRAGALGHPYGVTTSLAGSSLGDDLAAAGRYFTAPDPNDPARSIGLVAAVRPDVTFIHAPAADERGAVLASPPFGEGFWGALGATRGVIVTAERIVAPQVTKQHAGSVVLPPHRVLAVCHAPLGAHPQPLYVAPPIDAAGYRDDFAAYELFRAIALDDADHGEIVDEVMLGSDEAYRAHFEAARRSRETIPPKTPSGLGPEGEPSAEERAIVLGARRIARAVRERGYRVILAGIGRAFDAARMAKVALEREGIDVFVVVETGMFGIDCGPGQSSFLLSHDVIAGAERLSSVEDVLGTLVCGADNLCLGVIGAAEVDARGRVNTTKTRSGRMLLGSGGANDIASNAAEVIVMASADRRRLVPEVAYVTSPGERVRSIVTEAGVLARDDASSPFRIEEAFDAAGDAAGSALGLACPFAVDGSGAFAAIPPSREERLRLEGLALGGERPRARST